MNWKLFLLCLILVLVVGPASSSQVSDDLTFQGLIEPKQMVNLSAPTGGTLETVEVERGDVIHEGQILARLESSVQKATLEIAEARAESRAELHQRKTQLALIARTHGKDEELYKRGIISEQEIFESRAQKELAEAALLGAEENIRLNELERDRAQALLEQRTLRSPVEGVVVDRFLSPGELVDDTVVFKLAQIDPLVVEVILPVWTLGKIAVGSEARVQPEEPVTEARRARVTVVDRVVDAASGTYRVRLEIPNSNQSLPAGLKCVVTFVP